MISQLYILSLRGDVILKREFTWDNDKSSNEYFFRRLRNSESLPPIFSDQETTFIHTSHGHLIFMCTTKDNISPSYGVDFLFLIKNLIIDFCGSVSEDIIRKNFLLLYEIIDEVVDFGFIQTTASDSIRDYLVNDVILKEDYLPSYPSLSIPSKPVKTSESKEEVFIDVIEKVTALFNSHGFLLNGNIDGCIKLRSFLKGKPEVEIGLSSYFDRQITLNTELKNFNFHSKVDYSRFCQDKVLTVDPPLGEIIVMNYRILEQVDTPFKVFPYVEKINSYKYEILVKIKSMFSNKLTASIVKATFHVPKVTASVIIEHLKKTKGQKSFFDKTLKKVVWEIEEFKGSKEITFKAVVSLDSALLHKPVLKQVSLKFEISGYSTSGMSIKYFKTLEQKQKDITKWIRYSTNSSSYICRINS